MEITPRSFFSAQRMKQAHSIFTTDGAVPDVSVMNVAGSEVMLKGDVRYKQVKICY